MNSPSYDRPTMVDEIERDTAGKARALTEMLKAVTAGRGGHLSLQEYLDASGGMSAESYVAACAILRDTWENTFQPPSPGHIRSQARKFEAKTRSEVRDEMTAKRLDYARRHRMTPEKVRAELDNPQHVDPNPVVEKLRIAGLNRALSGDFSAVKMRKRGEGGLQPLGESLGGAV